MSRPPGDAVGSDVATTGNGGSPCVGWRTTDSPARAAVWHVLIYATPSTCARQLPQSPARQSVPPDAGTSPARRMATAIESLGSKRSGRPSTTIRLAAALAGVPEIGSVMGLWSLAGGLCRRRRHSVMDDA